MAGLNEEYWWCRIIFKDGSTRDYSLKADGIHEHTAKIAAGRMCERLTKLGRDTHLNDLRHFNGNHATGRGKNPGPKADRICAWWKGVEGSEPDIYV